jgi:hypothetical protein
MQNEKIPFSETKQTVVCGTMYQSGNGQVVIDEHANDHEHLLAQATHHTQPLYRCRTYLAEIFPKEWLGKKGKFCIDRVVLETGDVASVMLTFIPEAGSPTEI